MKRSPATLLLGLYLTLLGLKSLIPAFNFDGSSLILAVLALISGILFLVGR